MKLVFLSVSACLHNLFMKDIITVSWCTGLTGQGSFLSEAVKQEPGGGG